MTPRARTNWLLLVTLVPLSAYGSGPDEKLWVAARKGDVQAVRSLLAGGAEVNAKTEYGATALSYACDKGHVEVVGVLIEHGADVNVSDSFYQATPLTWAAMNDHAQVVRLLLANGARGGDDILRTAVVQEKVETVGAVLDSARISPESLATALGLATGTENEQIIELLTKAGASMPEQEPGAKVSREALDNCAGTYKCAVLDMQLKITANETDLSGVVSGQPTITYRPTDGRTFKSVEYAGITLVFNAEDGRVTGLTLKQGGGVFEFDRVADAAGPQTAEQTPEPAYVQVSEPKNWPSFRGPHASGNGDGQHPPLHWDTETGLNIRWKTPIPGLAHSCPVVWGDRVFVTTAVSSDPDTTFRAGLYGDVTSVKNEPTHTWQVYCLNKETGEIIWRRDSHQGVPRALRHIKASQANCTPAVDGKHVVASFASEGLYCYDFHGELLWKRDLGVLDAGWFYDPDYGWGFGSSPVIFRDLVIVQADILDDSFIAAFSLNDGREVWRTPRSEIPSWGTPTVCDDGRRPQVITNSSKCIYGYDPLTGRELWRLRGNSEVTVGTPVTAGGLMFFTGGYRPFQPIYAVKTGAVGDITPKDGQESNEHVAWSKRRGGTYIPTPLVYGDYLYTCANNGVLTCYELRTGRQVYRTRIADGKGGGYTASPVAADGRLYFTSEDGGVFVVKTGPEYELLASNPVGEVCMATPAISDGMIFLRARHHLYSIAHQDRPTGSDRR